MTDQTARAGRKSTAGLVSEAVSHVTGLVRKEVDLVRAELGENASKAAVAVGLIAGSVVFILVALHVLSAALVAGLAEAFEIDAGWAALIVGVAYLLIAVILVRKGTSNLKAVSLAPTRTVQNVRRDAVALKEKLHG